MHRAALAEACNDKSVSLAPVGTFPPRRVQWRRWLKCRLHSSTNRRGCQRRTVELLKSVCKPACPRPPWALASYNGSAAEPWDATSPKGTPPGIPMCVWSWRSGSRWRRTEHSKSNMIRPQADVWRSWRLRRPSDFDPSGTPCRRRQRRTERHFGDSTSEQTRERLERRRRQAILSPTARPLLGIEIAFTTRSFDPVSHRIATTPRMDGN